MPGRISTAFVGDNLGDVGDRWRAVAALVDRSRRALYLYVRRQDHPVSREEAAAAQRLSRSLAAFHLDKLVDAGLLQARYQAPAGRARGRGRAPKVYEPAADDLTLTIPERRYQVVAEILADAIAAEPQCADEAVRGQARQYGHDLGQRLHQAGDTDLPRVLDGLGFEPRRERPGHTLLHNCPFKAVATRHTDLICGMNHALLGGLVEGLRADGVRVRLVPRPPACCVELIDSS
jgi:predicted ArsR family transcriptional regulator